jgi:hypothetical protein
MHDLQRALKRLSEATNDDGVYIRMHADGSGGVHDANDINLGIQWDADAEDSVSHAVIAIDAYVDAMAASSSTPSIALAISVLERASAPRKLIEQLREWWSLPF